MLSDTFDQTRKAIDVGCWLAIIITYVCMNNCGPGFECFLSAFNLLGNCNWNCRVVIFSG